MKKCIQNKALWRCRIIKTSPKLLTHQRTSIYDKKNTSQNMENPKPVSAIFIGIIFVTIIRAIKLIRIHSTRFFCAPAADFSFLELFFVVNDLSRKSSFKKLDFNVKIIQFVTLCKSVSRITAYNFFAKYHNGLYYNCLLLFLNILLRFKDVVICCEA